MFVKYVTSDRKHEGFVKVSNSMKFSELQKRIAQKVKIPKDGKVLFYLKDILVKDDLTFEDYKMRSGDIVRVLVLPANCTVISVGTRAEMLVKYVSYNCKHEGFLKVSKSTKISELKERIAQKIEIPKTKVLLFFEYREVEDDRTFEDYNINSGDQIGIMILKKTRYQKKVMGPILGIPVGMEWVSRKAVSDAGVHKPTQRGISGDPVHGADSIVLSGGYKDDLDCEIVICYTGTGPRDQSGKPIAHQTLIGVNEALAKNCNIELNRIRGGISRDWNNCKPVRVVRAIRSNATARPEKYRYDGLFRVCGYWPFRGRHGRVVWRFLLVKVGHEAQAYAIHYFFRNCDQFLRIPRNFSAF